MSQSFKNLKVLITAGPTREYLDPVRFLSNASSGKMGFAIAQEAAKRGAKVTLISGPVVKTSKFDDRLSHARVHYKIINVTSANEMYRATIKEARRADIIIMTAAVADYRPYRYEKTKIKKKSEMVYLALVPTKDILKELGKRKKPGQILVGFAAETNDLVAHARQKMRSKNLDMIVANLVGKPGRGFESDQNQAILLSASGFTKKIPLISKSRMAFQILDFIASIL